MNIPKNAEGLPQKGVATQTTPLPVLEIAEQ